MTNLKTPVILFVDPDTGEIIETNDRACAVYEDKSESLTAVKLTKLDVYYSKEILLEDKLNCKEPVEFLTYHQLANGEVWKVNVIVEPVKIKGGSVLQLIISFLENRGRKFKEIDKGKKLGLKENNHEPSNFTDFHKKLLNYLNIGAAVYEVKGNGEEFIFKDFNKAAEEIDNVIKEEVIGKKIEEVFPQVKEFGLLKVLRKVWKSGKPKEFPAQLYQDGERSGWRKNYLYKLPSGEIVAIYEDITIKEESRRKLARTQQQLQTIFESIADGIIVTDTAGKIELMNPKAKELTGWGEEARGKELTKVFNIINEKTKEKVKTPVNKVLTTGEVQGLANHTILITKDGKKRAIADSAAPVRNKKGEVKGVVMTFRDVTDKRKMQNELRKSRKRYKALFENTGAGSFIIEEDTTILLINEELEYLTGYKKEEVEGKMSWKDLVAEEEDLQKMIRYHKQRRKDDSEVPNRYKFKLQTKTGEIKDVLITVDVIPDTNQSVASITDISDLKETERKLESTVERLNEMVVKIIDTLGSTVAASDPYTSDHQQRVAKLAAAIADKLNLSSSRKKGLKLAALVHDLGKIKIPISILTKPTELTEVEFELIKTHPQAGYEILKQIDFEWPIAKIVKQHHEKLNGSGYPDGLTEEQILLEAKIITVADVVEAMNSHRPYRPALGLDVALGEIKKNKGILYDNKVVEACLEVFKEDREFLQLDCC